MDLDIFEDILEEPTEKPAQRGFGKFQPKTKKKKQSGLSQPPVTSCGLLPVSKNSTTLSTPSLVLDETSSRNNELKAQPEKPQKEDDIPKFSLNSCESPFNEPTTFEKKQLEASAPFSQSHVLSDDIEYDPDFVNSFSHLSQPVLVDEPSNHPDVDIPILDCGIDSQDIQLNDFYLTSQNGDAQHDLLHPPLTASGPSKAEHTFPSYLLHGTSGPSHPTIFDHALSKQVNGHDNAVLNNDQVISDEEVVDFFSNEDLIDDLIIKPAAPSCINASNSMEFNPKRYKIDESKRCQVDGLSISSGNNHANAENTMIHPDWATSTHVGSGTNAEEGSNTMKLRKRMTARSPVFSFDDENDEDVGNFDTCQYEENVDDEYTGEEMGRKKKARKPRSSSQEKQKPVQMRKKSGDNVHHSNQEAPKKKFPHSTRRKRRQLDKKLLETPDDEIDERRIPIKELILLSEARERKFEKVAASNKSKDSNDRLNDNEDGEESKDKHGLEKYNHHSFMNKARSERWSKAGTELFYQAIRQFGTDFGMIQQLFPNRTRHQMKLKFKNEERKHPLLMADALTHRSNDFSQFEILIKQLEIQSAENYENNPIAAETDGNDLGSAHDFSPVIHEKEDFVVFDDDEFVDFG